MRMRKISSTAKVSALNVDGVLLTLITADDQDIYLDPEAEDEDGRFFGGGLNSEQKVCCIRTRRHQQVNLVQQILDIFEAAGDEGEVRLVLSRYV
jgi:hypothetical protein